MLLIEARDAGKRDIRHILREAYEVGGGYEGAAERIQDGYGEAVTIATLHAWFADWKWSVQRVLVTPGLPAGCSDEGSHELAAA